MRGPEPMNAAIHWSGPVLAGGALALALAIILISSRPVVAQSISSDVAALLLLSAALLLPSLPAIYPPQAGAHPLLFVPGAALPLGLLLPGISTFQADVLPRPAAVLLLAATAGFFFVFFVSLVLPAAAGPGWSVAL